MQTRIFRALAALGTLGVLVGAQACVSDRPSRNGVFNENQYVRKSFLVKDPSAKPEDPGYTWRVHTTVTEISSPNVFSGMGLQVGSFDANPASTFVRFQVTQNKLNMLSTAELSTAVTSGRTAEVVNAWPVTNVDLKYQVNLDGEKTNFYQENQELDWQTRQWIKLNFDKNDLSDLVGIGGGVAQVVSKCIIASEASATLLPNSFKVDENSGYMEWKVQVTLPVNLSDEACITMYGEAGNTFARMGRSSVTLNMLYSLARQDKNGMTAEYVPMPIDEKDAIRHKYGPITSNSYTRDEETGRLAAQEYVIRYNPNRPLVQWYYTANFPQEYRDIFANIETETNKLMEQNGAKLRYSFKEVPAGVTPGDARYSWFFWVNDKDSVEPGLGGATDFVYDRKTGELHHAQIFINEFTFKQSRLEPLAYYLNQVGALPFDYTNNTDWPPPPGKSTSCTDGELVQLDDVQRREIYNASSTLFRKMGTVLPSTTGVNQNVGPADFVPDADSTFLEAYYKAIPYTIFTDPDANDFVTPEGGAATAPTAKYFDLLKGEVEFRKLMNSIEMGQAPFDDSGDGPDMVKAANAYTQRLHELTVAHHKFEKGHRYLLNSSTRRADSLGAFNPAAQRVSRKCVGGAWENKDQWTKRLAHGFYAQVITHEFGHAIGLDHNFMGSVDWKNWPMEADGVTPKARSSSVMEYPHQLDDYIDFVWAPYDVAAISWIYANGQDKNAPLKDGDPSTTSLTGQKDATHPWKDPGGFNQDGSEHSFLWCTDKHNARSPLCQWHDLGTRPSEIIANYVSEYEFGYLFRNFRRGRKVWNLSGYAGAPTNIMAKLRLMVPLHAFDWSFTQIPTLMRKIGVNPPPNSSALQYYLSLAERFSRELSYANQISAAFHYGIVQQGSGERPFATIYDKFYGDVTQQGIILDKVQAITSFSDLWLVDNYDRNLEGTYTGQFGNYFGDAALNALSDKVIESMVGGGYDVYAFQAVASLSSFSQATQRVEFQNGAGRPEMKDWIGSIAFYREPDLLTYFQSVAARYRPAETGVGGKYYQYDPRKRRAFPNDTHLSDEYGEFYGPDGRRYIIVFIPNRNSWYIADRDRNTAMYQQLRVYNEAVIRGEDDGNEFGNTLFRREKSIKNFRAFWDAAN